MIYELSFKRCARRDPIGLPIPVAYQPQNRVIRRTRGPAHALAGCYCGVTHLRKRLLVLTVTALTALGAAYIVSPFLSAVHLRQAIARGDRPTVDRMIEWKSLRESLRYSIARNAELLPAATDAARAVRPTMWQRIRSMFGHTMLDRFIEHYITPAGLTKLYHAKQRRYGEPKKPAFIQAGISFDQLRQTWRRVKSAKFLSPFRFVLELEDRHDPDRRIKSLFRLSHISLTGFEWKLVAVKFRYITAKERRLGRLNGFEAGRH